ncbi:MAG TPA: hypothetical protein VMB50_01795 [Myxococcales bacterium]|nr:hypothetical protein [Myxococcales bacterium]
MRTRPLPLVGLVALATCGQSQQPCTGTGCLNVAGTYTFVLGTSTVSCSNWEKNAPPSSLMEVTQGPSPSQLGVTLWPVTDNPHFLTGTLYANGSINVAESEQSTLIGIPWATLTGSFASIAGQSGGEPFQFNGQIFLQGGTAQTTTAGQTGGATAGQTGGGAGGLACSGGTTFKAEETSTTILPDAGTIPTPDGGDAGH